MPTPVWTSQSSCQTRIQVSDTHHTTALTPITSLLWHPSHHCFDTHHITALTSITSLLWQPLCVTALTSITSLLWHPSHHCCPVPRSAPQHSVFVLLITKLHLLVAIQQIQTAQQLAIPILRTHPIIAKQHTHGAPILSPIRLIVTAEKHMHKKSTGTDQPGIRSYPTCPLHHKCPSDPTGQPAFKPSPKYPLHHYRHSNSAAQPEVRSHPQDTLQGCCPTNQKQASPGSNPVVLDPIPQIGLLVTVQQTRKRSARDQILVFWIPSPRSDSSLLSSKLNWSGVLGFSLLLSRDSRLPLLLPLLEMASMSAPQ